VNHSRNDGGAQITISHVLAAPRPGGRRARVDVVAQKTTWPSSRSRTLQEQPGNLKLAICVLQLNVPLAFRYSLVYQNVQSSTGSTVIAL